MTATLKIACIILCGGRSSRMGGTDKSLLPIGGKPILARIIDRISPQLTRIAINANGDPARFAAFDLPVVPDSLGNFPGPLAGILAGMDWAAMQPDCSHLVSIAGDTPFFPVDLIQRLSIAGETPRSISVATSNQRRHPVFALWPISIREDLARFLQSGNGKVSAFIDMHSAIDVDFPLMKTRGVAFDPFFNINTPDDLNEARRMVELGE